VISSKRAIASHLFCSPGLDGVPSLGTKHYDMVHLSGLDAES